MTERSELAAYLRRVAGAADASAVLREQARAVLVKFDPAEPRDIRGRWTRWAHIAREAAEDHERRHARLAAAWNSGIRDRRSLAGGKMGETELVTFNDGTTAILKRAMNNPTLPLMSPKKQADSEEAAAWVGTAVGVRVPAVHRVSEDTVLKEYVDGESGMEWFDTPAKRQALFDAIPADALRRLGLLTVLIQDGDRHPGNLIVQTDADGNPTGLPPIDFGNAFASAQRVDGDLVPLPEYLNPEMTDPFTVTGGRDWRGVPERGFLSDGMSVSDMEDVLAALQDLRDDFTRIGQDVQFKLMMERAKEMLADARSKERRAARAAA